MRPEYFVGLTVVACICAFLAGYDWGKIEGVKAYIRRQKQALKAQQDEIYRQQFLNQMQEMMGGKNG